MLLREASSEYILKLPPPTARVATRGASTDSLIALEPEPLKTFEERQSVAAVPRAARFPVKMSIRFRGIHETAWHLGWTQNVSRSGVLFRSAEALEKGTWVEMGFALPVEAQGRPGTEVACHGHIIRVEAPFPNQEEALLAATISDYHFVRGGK